MGLAAIAMDLPVSLSYPFCLAAPAEPFLLSPAPVQTALTDGLAKRCSSMPCLALQGAGSLLDSGLPAPGPMGCILPCSL